MFAPEETPVNPATAAALLNRATPQKRQEPAVTASEPPQPPRPMPNLSTSAGRHAAIREQLRQERLRREQEPARPEPSPEADAAFTALQELLQDRTEPPPLASVQERVEAALAQLEGLTMPTVEYVTSAERRRRRRIEHAVETARAALERAKALAG
jgi:hypothetical protein